MNKIAENKYGLNERDLHTIFAILIKYKEIKTVHLFGSRVLGNYKKGSDIDLAIMNKGINNEIIRRLKEDFEESSLPYTVDLVNFPLITNHDFIDHIKRAGTLLYTSAVKSKYAFRKLRRLTAI